MTAAGSSQHFPGKSVLIVSGPYLGSFWLVEGPRVGWKLNGFISRVSVVRSHPPLLQKTPYLSFKTHSIFTRPISVARDLNPGLNHRWPLLAPSGTIPDSGRTSRRRHDFPRSSNHSGWTVFLLALAAGGGVDQVVECDEDHGFEIQSASAVITPIH